MIFIAELCAWITWGGLPVLAEPEPQPSAAVSTGDKKAEAIPVNMIGERTGRLKETAREIERVLSDNIIEIEVAEEVSVLTSKLSQFADEHDSLIQTNTPSSVWYSRSLKLNEYRSKVSVLAASLQKRTEELQKLGDDLAFGQEVWSLTKDSVKSVKLNKTVVDDINLVLDQLSKYEKQVRQNQSELLNLQNKVFTLNDTINKLETSLNDAVKNARSQVWQRNSDYMWVRLNDAVLQETCQTWNSSLEAQMRDLKVYWDQNGLAVFVYLLIFALVWLGLRGVYNVIRPWGSQGGELQYAVRLVEMPIPIAALAVKACFLSGEGASLNILSALASLFVIVPSLIVLRRIVDDHFTPILNALLVVYIIDMVNQLAHEAASMARILNLCEACCIVCFLVFYLRSALFEDIARIKGTKTMRAFSIIGYGTLVCSVLAVFANIVGYVELASRIIIIVLMSTVSGFMLVAVAQFIVALLLFAMTVPPLSLSNLVQTRWSDILRTVKTVLYWCILYLVIDNACGLAGYMDALPNLFTGIFNCQIAYGSVNVTVGQCLVAVAVLVGSYKLSKLFLAMMEYDFLPRWHLKPNAANVVLFFARYVPYIVCFFIACAVLGLSVENLAMVVSALSVGIGFGLQNVINNFISGLILLFEPRIAVGGVVEFGSYSGVLVNVGMRASVVRMFDGREVIVPNSELISNKVVSITNTEAVPYRSSISFALLGPVDIARVREIVEKCALEHTDVMNTPAPILILKDMETGYPKFILKFWTRSYDLLVVTQNDLSFRIVKRLQEEGWQLAGNKVELVHSDTVETLPIVNTQKIGST